MVNKTTNKKDTAITTYDKERFKKNVSLGISGIDPADVMPPMIKLVQGSTDFSRVVDIEGETAKPGEFFFMDDKTIHSSVIGYVLNLSKVNDPYNPRDDGTYEKMYRLVGVLENLKTTFTLNFRRGAINTVKNFLGNVFSSYRGAYTFKIEITSEQKKGEKGNYLLPVISIKEKLSDPKILSLLETGAKKYGYLEKMSGDEDLTVKHPKNALPDHTEEPVDTGEPLTENINPEDIPF